MDFLWQKLKPYRRLLVISLVLATVNQVFSLVNPQIMRILVDRYATKIDQYDMTTFMKGVTTVILIGVGAAAISRIAKTFQDYYVSLMSQKVGAYIYADSITHAFNLPYRVFEDRKSGSLLDKLQKARDDIQKFLKSLINTVFLQTIGIILVMGYAFYVHWLAGLSYLLMLPILAVTTILISRRIRKSQERIVTTSADLAGTTTENIRNVTLIKSLGLENQEVDHLNTINEKLIDLEIDKIKLIRTLTFTQGTLINFLRSCLQLLLLWLVFKQTISLGEFFTLLFYSFVVFNPLYELPTVATDYQEAKASNETLEEIHAIPPEETPDDTHDLGTIHEIKFDHVSFSYDQETDALQDISFSIKQGETIAFVGPSGAGKSTVVKLLCGLYQPTDGKILFNGYPSKQVNREQLKQRLGIVDQETKLFAGTIRENLLFINPEATDKQCIKALKQAQLLDLIRSHKKGLDAIIGEGGLKLSGGQKQRLAIARALLRKPDVLIFDEATSSLDSLVEARITDTIKDITKDHPELISILVAHRLSTIMHADRIFVLEQGIVKEQGQHKELLQEKGLYYALWRQQSGSSQAVENQT